MVVVENGSPDVDHEVPCLSKADVDGEEEMNNSEYKNVESMFYVAVFLLRGLMRLRRGAFALFCSLHWRHGW